MSVFQVNLHSFNDMVNTDAYGTTTVQEVQRTTYVTGPDRQVRVLKDGTQFTGSNYYKRYCYPALPLDQAFLTLITDDGSDYDDTPGAVNSVPVSYSLTLGTNQTYSVNPTAPILSTYGAGTNFCQINNLTNSSIKVRINGVAIFTLGAGDIQIFNADDLSVGLVEFDTTGKTLTSFVTEVVAGVKNNLN